MTKRPQTPQVQIEYDHRFAIGPGAPVLRYGCFVSSYPEFFYGQTRWELANRVIRSVHDIPWSFGLTKKQIAEYLGESASSFARRWNELTRKAWIQPVKSILDAYAVTGRAPVGLRYNLDKVAALHRRPNIYMRAMKDNQFHLLPLFYSFPKCTDARMAREIIGRGRWKRLCNNAPSRNNVLADCCRWGSDRWVGTASVAMLHQVVDWPTTLLREDIARRCGVHGGRPSYVRYQLVGDISWAIGHARLQRRASDVELVVDLCNRRRELRDLAGKLDKTFNDKWGADRVLRTVAQWRFEFEQQQLREYQDKLNTVFYDKGAELPRSYEVGDYQAVLINTGRELQKEGWDMHHCVFADYFDRCKRRKYAVYSVRDGSSQKKVSTLAFSREVTMQSCVEVERWKLKTHLGPCNNDIDDDVRYFGCHLRDRVQDCDVKSRRVDPPLLPGTKKILTRAMVADLRDQILVAAQLPEQPCVFRPEFRPFNLQIARVTE